MPPIMGAAAFVMAEFLGIPYLQVAMYALIPAVLYFLAVFMAVHFEAKRTGMRGLPRADLPRLRTVLRPPGRLQRAILGPRRHRLGAGGCPPAQETGRAPCRDRVCPDV